MAAAFANGGVGVLGASRGGVLGLGVGLDAVASLPEITGVGGTAIANVAANDTVNGFTATPGVGGNATLFVYDDASNQFVRRSTNVKKENGDRAVGTQLAPDHPGQAVLRKGQPYKGPAVLFGKSFMTAYYPVMNPSGKVIGILYVGIAMAEYEAMLAQAIQTMAIAAGIAALDGQLAADLARPRQPCDLMGQSRCGTASALVSIRLFRCGRAPSQHRYPMYTGGKTGSLKAVSMSCRSVF